MAGAMPQAADGGLQQAPELVAAPRSPGGAVVSRALRFRESWGSR